MIPVRFPQCLDILPLLDQFANLGRGVAPQGVHALVPQAVAYVPADPSAARPRVAENEVYDQW